MSSGNISKLLNRHVGDVQSVSIGGQVVRREMSIVDGVKFYRFTVNPGMRGEVQTFWSTDEDSVRNLVLRRYLKK